MNRCTYFLTAALTCLVLSSGLLPLPASAQTEEVKPNVRQFPKTAYRGELIVFSAPEITMDGKPDRLSPAVRIFDINDKLVLSGTLSTLKLVVNYMRDNTGLVHHVWILNSEEIKQKMPGRDGTGVSTNIRFMSDTPPASDDGNTPYDQLPRFKQ
ncbi:MULTISPECIES: hypothetical protein [Polaromonas]|uniref:Uncharacterized protein n=1 Tax=Polaromonas aquatica TaxID=332657 RepID=A0ABW1U2Q4_9BURK